MPFITEEIWQALPHDGESIMTAGWPKLQPELLDEAAEQHMMTIMEAIKAIRNMRAEVNVPPGKKSEVILQVAAPELMTVVGQNEQYFKSLAAAESVMLLNRSADKPENAMTAVVSGIEIYLPLKGLIDIEKETGRLNKELAVLDKEIARIVSKLSNEGFIAKAPPEVIEKERAKELEYREKQSAINERLQYLASL